MSLTSLGMSAEQERVYRYFLRRPQASLAAAATDLGLPDLPATVAELRELALMSESRVAAKPAVAVDLLVRQRMERIRRQLSELTGAWDALTELSEEHRSGKSIRLVEHLRGADVAERMNALMADDLRELAHMKPRATDGAASGRRFRRLAAAGLRRRTLLPAQALRDPTQADHARTWHAGGDLHRVTTEPLRHLTIVNRSVAFVQADVQADVQTDTGGPQAGVLEIRLPGLVAVLVDVYEGMWARARDLDDQRLSPIEHQVLDALTRYDTDDAAARALNVSVRKFRAHVADLMTRLGAKTRFQAALQAKARGWL